MEGDIVSLVLQYGGTHVVALVALLIMREMSADHEEKTTKWPVFIPKTSILWIQPADAPLAMS